MKKYMCKETGDIESLEDIKKLHKEIVFNSSYSKDYIVQDLDTFLVEFYDEVIQE